MASRNRHHYVPRLILDRFVDGDGMLHVFDRRRAENGIQPQSPKDTFVEKHLYSAKLKDGRRDRSLEDWFADLEGFVAPIVSKIVDNARINAPAGLSDKEREVWDFYLAMQWRRVPELHTQVIDDERFERDLAESVAEFATMVRPLTEDEQRWADDPSARPFFRHNVTVSSLRSRSDGQVFLALQRRGMTVARPERLDKSFILASRPILRAGPPKETLLHPEIEAWFVLAPDVAVSPWGHRGTDEFRSFTTFGVRKLNELLAKQSQVIASGSSTLVASLARPR